MKFDAFEQRATELWQQIPEEYRAGVDGLRVERGAVAHPTLPDIYTLGECLTENYASDFGGPDTTRSLVVLYYGSFWRLARLDADFDWEHELWETLTHELQHHLESLAEDDGLEDFDYAADENFKRLEGREFDPFFFRGGVPVADGWYRVEEDHFREYAAGPAGLAFEWAGRRYRVPVPESRADVLFLDVNEGAHLPAGLVLVVVRPTRTLRLLRSIFTGERASVEEYEVSAEELADD